MNRFSILLVALTLALVPLAAAAHQGLHLHDPYARMTPQSGAVYVLIHNPTDTEDRLIGASSPMADMVMLMSSDAVNGASSMTAAKDGFVVPAKGDLVLQSGQGHIMLMGLKGKYRTGDTIEVTLRFQKFGEVTLTVPVLSARAAPPADVETDYDGKSGTLTGAAPMTTDVPGMDMKGMDMPGMNMKGMDMPKASN
jgi:periplasmic copper chaperone A